MVEHDVRLLLNWFKANQLSLNLNKTVIMNFWSNSDPSRSTINGVQLPVQTTKKFLGVHLDDKLNWSVHINQLHKKLSANRHLLNLSKNLLSKECLVSIFHAHISSHIGYGLLVWGSKASKKLLKPIQVQTNICIWSICKKGKCTTVTPLYRELKILQIDDLIELELAKFRYRIVNKKYPDVLLDILNSHGGRKEHKYPTRHKNLPNIQKHTGAQFNMSFMCKGITTYTQLPNKIK